MDISKPELHLLSASDRFNYGDLLFPIILSNELNLHGDFNIKNYATINSDLTNLGAIKTLRYKSLYKVKTSNNWLIVAGGEVMGANWSKLLSFIYKPYLWLYEKAEKNNQLHILENITKYCLGVHSNLAFIPTEDRITRHFNLIYNSIGGISFENNKHNSDLLKVKKNIKYISARDIKSQRSITSIGIEHVKLTPDSAILMSEYYPINKLSQLVSPDIRKPKGNHIALQLGFKKSIAHVDEIARQINTLSKKISAPVILCPIGNCPGHDDTIVLDIIKKKLDNAIIIKPTNIWDIMYTISNSQIFIGTSLHGVITAMSYNIPYLGINKKIEKLDSYLNTWGVSCSNSCTDFTDIFDNAMEALDSNDKNLEESRSKQILLARESIKNIGITINQNNQPT